MDARTARKIMLNAMYGYSGARANSQTSSPIADTVALLGRYAISQIDRKKIVYMDSTSVYMVTS